MLEIVIATNNDHKMHEFRELFKGLPIVLYSLKDLGIFSNPEENGTTYQMNSFIKANDVAKQTNKIVLADDSGIEVNSLNNFPGIHSARFASSMGGNKIANQKIIERLSSYKDYSASFRCVITVLNLTKETLYFEGVAKGKILSQPVGENGFGYDPIFFSNDANMPFGTASEEIKNKFSHRAKACQEFIKYLKEAKLI